MASMGRINKALLVVAGLVLWWALGSIFDNILWESIMAWLKATFGIEEGDVVAVVTKNLIPILGVVFAVLVIYWIARHDRQHGAVSTLNEAFQKTQRLFNRPITDGEDAERWKAEVNELPRWIRSALRGKIPETEINVLINSSAGPRLSFRAVLKSNDYLNYLHYLEQRIEKLIAKYS
jgi:hypothetical protein